MTYWTMADGRKIDVDQMSVEHLRNTLKMIIRVAAKSKPKPRFELNGDMAQFFNDTQDNLEEDGLEDFHGGRW